ncbi:MAG: hypothetical protein EBY38_06620, partial [Flavobacteriaceae bacterium]|nr:hypothetical protein [Flavobacteriaceae bacterium]
MRWLFFFLFYGAIDFYAYQAFKTLTKHPWAPWVYFGTSFLVLAIFVGQLFSMGEARSTQPGQLYVFGLFLAFFVPKLLIGAFMITEDIVRLIWGVICQFTAEPTQFLPGRRRFVSSLALITAALPFGALLYGMFRGKYQYQVLSYALSFDDLPDAFEDYTIVHISDLHCGSFDDPEKVDYGLSLIQDQQPDLILFTGDLVNNRADELNPWQELFSQLSAPDGVYSVLGNHDYGDYVPWANVQEKQANMEDLKNRQEKMGWRLLLNEHQIIERGSDRIALIGVENWGAGGFKKSGDFQVATQGIASETDVPIGIIDLNLGHHFPIAWLARDALMETTSIFGEKATQVESVMDMMDVALSKFEDEDIRKQEQAKRPSPILHPREDPRYPAAGFNAVLHPMRGFTLKGILLQLGNDYPYSIYQ